MASDNPIIAVFTAQATDTTSAAFELTPGIDNQPRYYDIVLSGGFGGGTFTMTMSQDNGSTYVNILSDGYNYSQTVAGVGERIYVDRRMHVKGVLTGATSATLTAQLITPFKS